MEGGRGRPATPTACPHRGPPPPGMLPSPPAASGPAAPPPPPRMPPAARTAPPGGLRPPCTGGPPTARTAPPRSAPAGGGPAGRPGAAGATPTVTAAAAASWAGHDEKWFPIYKKLMSSGVGAAELGPFAAGWGPAGATPAAGRRSNPARAAGNSPSAAPACPGHGVAQRPPDGAAQRLVA